MAAQTIIGPARREKLALCVILIAHIGLSVWSSLVTPVWEAYDETGHYFYARYIALNNQLPDLSSGSQIAFDESHQPPLYYWLASIPMRFVDTSDDLRPRFAASPVAVIPPAQDAWPYAGTVLAFRLSRMVTVMLSVLGPLFTWLALRVLLPQRPSIRLMGAALYAFWPQYVFQSGTITNDIAIGVCAAAVFWATARLVCQPPSRMPFNAGLVAATGVLASLTKDSGLTLLLFAVGAIAVVAVARMRVSRSQVGLAALIAVMVLGAGLSFGAITSQGRTLRQWKVIPGASKVIDGLFPVTPAAVSQDRLDDQQTVGPESAQQVEPLAARLESMLRTAPNVLGFDTFKMLLASYGWGTLGIPDLWYFGAALALIMPLPGILNALRRKPERLALALALLFFAAVAAAPIGRVVGAPDTAIIGRFIVPALAGITAIVALAVGSLHPVLRAPLGTLALATVSMIALMTPWVVIAPNYRMPELIDPTRARSNSQVPLSIMYGDQIELLGYSHLVAKAQQDGWARYRLYWRGLRPMSEDYTLQLEMFSSRGESFRVLRNETPGRNLFPTSNWTAGMAFADDYAIHVGADSPAPAMAGLKLRWLDPKTGQALQSLCNGTPCDPLVGALPIALGSEMQERLGRTSAKFAFGARIELIGIKMPSVAAAGESIAILPIWRARLNLKGDYTVFVHIFDNQRRLVAQTDAPPLGGTYPTRFWLASEIVPDRIEVPLPPGLNAGEYTVVIGLYDSATKDRLSSSDSNGKMLPDGVITAGTFEIR
ncbi:MAG: hypothetical protein IPO29_04160 [Anaerolineae bacterium]|nr:hypothetical protein [Anaerolineae bacterium]